MTETQKRPAHASGRPLLVRKVVLSDFLNVTWRMSAPVLAGAALGLLLDRQFNTAPTLFLIFIVAGFFAGLGAAIHLIMNANKQRSQQ